MAITAYNLKSNKPQYSSISERAVTVHYPIIQNYKAEMFEENHRKRMHIRPTDKFPHFRFSPSVCNNFALHVQNCKAYIIDLEKIILIRFKVERKKTRIYGV